MSQFLQEISVLELAGLMTAGKSFTILDVREAWELSYAQLESELVLKLPMSELSSVGVAAFSAALRDPQAEIVVMCHHGVRSASVAIWMMQNGWLNVKSLAGGIAAYAEQVDPSVGMY